MLYAVLCYNNEDITASWTKEEDDMVMHAVGSAAVGQCDHQGSS